MLEHQEVKRTALLVRCTAEEAELIRQAAKAERRTISGYILNGIMQRIAVQKKTHEHLAETLGRAARNPAIKKAKAQSSNA